MPLLGSILGTPEHGDKTEQTWEEVIASLRAEVAYLRSIVYADEAEPGVHGRPSGWRDRALKAERERDAAYEKLRDLNGQRIDSEASKPEKCFACGHTVLCREYSITYGFPWVCQNCHMVHLPMHAEGQR